MTRYLAIGLLLASFSAYGALHKWVDAEGKVHYSDTVPSQDIKAKTVRNFSATDSTTSSSAVAEPKSLAEREADARKAQKTKSEEADKLAQEQELANNKKKNCENARSNLSTLENAPRLMIYDAKGEPSILDDDARQLRIEEARKAISSNCN